MRPQTYRERLAAILPPDGHRVAVDDTARRAIMFEPVSSEGVTRLESGSELDGIGQGQESPEDRWGARIRVVRRFAYAHVKALSVLGLGGVIVATWAVMGAHPIPVAADPIPTAPIITPAPEVSVAPVWWHIHVIGAVAAPGVVPVEAGSRVMDAITAAGGLSQDADPADLNLAAVLTDGAQIVIGTQSEPKGEVRVGGGGSSVVGGSSGSGAGGSEATLLNLNTATSAQLDTLPGVGPVTAAAILAWRERNGSFTSVAQLQEVDGIGPKTFAQIEPYVRV